MAYFCVDFTGGNDGTGASGASAALAAATPFLTWDAMFATYATTDTILLKRGTTSVVHENGFPAETIIGAYYNSDGTDDITQPRPILDANADTFAFSFTDKDSTTVSDMKFINPGDNNFQGLLRFNRGDNITITGCEFVGSEESKGTGIVMWTGNEVNGQNNALTNVVIQNNSFSTFGVYPYGPNDVDAPEAIRLQHVGNITYTGDGSNGQPSNILIDNNTFTSCGKAIRQATTTDLEVVVDNGLLPTDIKITNNVIIDCGRAISQIGWMDVGANCINNNQCIRTGSSTMEALNVIQTQMCKGGEIRGNYIDGCETSDSGDGCGIIIDWGYPGAADAYISEDLEISENVIINCTYSDQGAGISVWKGSACTIAGNLIASCKMGVKINNTASTGNKVVNNTIRNTTLAGYLTWTAPEVELVNNIIDTTNIGIQVAGTAPVDPDEHHNCIYNVNSNNVTLDASDIITDPELNVDGSLQSTSPCVGIGVKWWGTSPRPVGYDGEPFPDWDIDIGGSQSLFSPHHPVNI